MGKQYSPACYFSIGAAILVADRLTKMWALNLDDMYQATSWLSFEVVFNRGVAWSMLHSQESNQFLMVSLLITAIAIAIAIHAFFRLRGGYGIMGELLVFAGAVSNLIDRALYKGVVDFIVLTMGGWQWPVFNIADVCIVFGVGIMFFQNYKEL